MLFQTPQKTTNFRLKTRKHHPFPLGAPTPHQTDFFARFEVEDARGVDAHHARLSHAVRIDLNQQKRQKKTSMIMQNINSDNAKHQ